MDPQLGKEIENTSQLVGWNADPVIFHSHYLGAVLLRETHPNPPAWLRVFGGVLDKVGKHLCQSGRVAPHAMWSWLDLKSNIVAA
jgi:hypothetical protein